MPIFFALISTSVKLRMPILKIDRCVNFILQKKGHKRTEFFVNLKRHEIYLNILNKEFKHVSIRKYRSVESKFITRPYLFTLLYIYFLKSFNETDKLKISKILKITMIPAHRILVFI